MNLKFLKKLLPGSRWGVISVPYLWMLVFFAIPFLIVLRISFSMRDQGRSPPYTPILEYIQNSVTMKLNLSNYVTLITDPLYLQAYGSSLWIAGVSTLLALLIGYPIAYVISKMPPSSRKLYVAVTLSNPRSKRWSKRAISYHVPR